jgi:nucleoside-diphosphate-sugar epimerase
MLDLAGTICRLAGRAPRIVTDPCRPEGRHIKSCDATLLRKVHAGLQRQIPLEQGLLRMIDWYAAEFGSVAE